MFPGEIQILSWLEGFRNPFWNRFWEIVTLFGEDTVMIALISILYFMMDKKAAYRLCFLTVTSLGINGIVKNLFRTPRPFVTGNITCLRPESATGYSFPSGHTQNFTTWSLALASQWKNPLLWIFGIFGSLLMGISRMFLGAHYLSDVIGAWILGSTVFLAGSYLYERYSDKKQLYQRVFLLFTPFFFFFLWKEDSLFSDFFKCYGLLGGFLSALPLEANYGDFKMEVSFFKKLVRVILATVLAIGLKEGLSLLWKPEILRISLVWDSFRYFILAFIMFGIYPVIIKKCNF